MIHVEIDVGDLDVAGGAFAGALSDASATVVRETVAEGQREALRRAGWKDRTGDARRKTKGEFLIAARGGAVGELRSDVPYASYLDDGTPEHVIEGNPYLHFVWKGVPMTLRRVHHPGTRGFGYMGAAYLKMETFGEAAMDREADAVARSFERRLNAAA